MLSSHLNQPTAEAAAPRLGALEDRRVITVRASRSRPTPMLLAEDSTTTTTTAPAPPTTSRPRPRPATRATAAAKPKPAPVRRPAPTPAPAPPTPSNSQTGQASWYDDDASSCAHRTLALGTVLLVTNLANGKQVRCTVTNRGPFRDGRIVDLSRVGFSQLAPTSAGVITVRIEW